MARYWSEARMFIPKQLKMVTAMREPVERARLRMAAARRSSIPDASMIPPKARATMMRAMVSIMEREAAPGRSSSTDATPDLAHVAGVEGHPPAGPMLEAHPSPASRWKIRRRTAPTMTPTTRAGSAGVFFQTRKSTDRRGR